MPCFLNSSQKGALNLNFSETNSDSPESALVRALDVLSSRANTGGFTIVLTVQTNPLYPLSRNLPAGAALEER
ncbi:hypothetical protein FGO68_gene12033 [Halteria grandinella]|uniref:Uncharacterized protein n=1 Tax=Halteria grandinella TaxID=5974 RepID=A0A8J8NDI5_HALGN|nr:hypothetical protein FGO68_gene12033 [Halteria grandinella]